MRADIVTGAVFPDYELTDHAKNRRRLSQLQGIDPMILLLARGLARRRGLPLAPRLLERTRATSEHAALGAAARRANVRGAFRVQPGCTLAHETVVLIDDVFTTGATASACAEALRAAGARTVHVYTVGRTP